MSWTCPGHYKVHVHRRDSPGCSVHRHCPVPLPALIYVIIELGGGNSDESALFC